MSISERAINRSSVDRDPVTGEIVKSIHTLLAELGSRQYDSRSRDDLHQAASDESLRAVLRWIVAEIEDHQIKLANQFDLRARMTA